MEPSGTTGDWTAGAAGAQVGSLNSCTPNCWWNGIHVEIQDNARADAEQCDEYIPEVDVCLTWLYTNSGRAAPVNSTCVPGSGQFQLIPFRTINRDQDSGRAAIMFPVQKSGTGVMTGTAWINNINIVKDQGLTLRVIHANKDYRFDENDSLITPNLVSSEVASTTTFWNGVVSGGAPFVLNEAPGNTQGDFVVDMSWSCATPLPHEEFQMSQGYTTSLNELGCIGGWSQKLTMRPIPFLSPTTLRLSPYGLVNDSIDFHLDTQSGWVFAFSKGDISIDGELLTFDSQVGATVRLDKAEWFGVPICSPGTYLLPVEQ